MAAAGIYCGSNRRHSTLRDGTNVIGTRYACFRKGVGVGLNLPYDPEYAGRYEPVDRRKIYCGTRGRLPRGYSYMGNNYMCFTKGIGVGRSVRAKRGRRRGAKGLRRRRGRMRFSRSRRMPRGKSRKKNLRTSRKKSTKKIKKSCRRTRRKSK